MGGPYFSLSSGFQLIFFIYTYVIHIAASCTVIMMLHSTPCIEYVRPT